MTEEQENIVRAAMSILGGIRTPARAAASRANGAKGGRPSHGIGDRREIYRAYLRAAGDLRAMSPAEREDAKAKAKAATESKIAELLKEGRAD